MEKIAPPPPSLNPKISPEDRLLFICARQRPAPEHRRMALALRQNHPLNWEAIFTTASRHGVAPLIYAAIRHIGPDALAVPDAVTAEFKRAYYSNIIRKERRAERLARGLAFFNERGIEVMLIKGGALDVLVYDRPWYTVPHDIDLVLKLKPEELPPATEAEIRHFFHKTGIEFDYFAHHDVTMNGVLPVDFGQIWDRAVKITLHGQPVWVMAPEDMLLAACINGCRKRFFRLKSLCDTAEIINKYPGLNWDRFIEQAVAFDSQRVVYAALLATTLTVGCALPNDALNALGVNPLRAGIIRRLSRYLLEHTPMLTRYPFAGTPVLGREVNLAVTLPYATYRWYQAGRKLKEILTARSAPQR